MATPPVEAIVVDNKVADTSENDAHHSKATLFVRNIPYDATNQELEEFFSDIGPTRSCFVVMDKSQEEAEKVQNKGYGYVHYALAEDAQRAITELKDVKFRGGRKLKVELALKKGEKAQERPAPKPAVEKTPTPKIPDTTTKALPEITYAPAHHYVTVEVSGLGSDITKKHIYKRARKIATVENIEYPIQDKEGTARIKFSSNDNAKLGAKQLDGHIFKGATLKAQVMASGAPPPRTKMSDPSIDKVARLIVRNLPWKYRESDLYKAFGEYGKVHQVKLPRKYNGGPFKGFAFIQFGNVDDAEKAINAMNATEHHGRTIAVDWALAKDKYVAAEENAEDAEEGAEDAEEGDEEEMDVDKEEESNDAADASDDKPEAGSDDEEEEVDDEEVIEEGMETGDASDEEMDEDEEDIDIEDEDEETAKPAYTMPTPAEGTTLFVRNLLFESEEEHLKELFTQWGAVRYAKITMDKETGRSRGTGFVCFKERESADQCLKEAEQLKATTVNDNSEAFPAEMMSNKQKKKTGMVQKSLLTPDINTGLAQKFTLQGRVLDVNRAVERNEANKLMEANALKKQKEDKRNIYLMKEGVIFADTPAAATLTEPELRKRQMSFAARKKLLATNPALYISKTRLSIRNLPLKTDDKDLKQIGFECITKFKTETKTGQRTDLSPDEKAEGWSFKPFVKQAKIIRSKDRVDSATQKLRSKGYGFLEYRTHSHALAALRYLNNNSKVFPGDPRRLIVEFSVDNKDVVERRSQRAAGGFSRNPGQGDDDTKRTTGRFGGNKRPAYDDDRRDSDRPMRSDGPSRGGFRGSSRGGSRGSSRGGFSGNKRPAHDDGDRDSNKRMRSDGPSRGRGSSRGEFRGSSRGEFRGSSRGEFRGTSRGGFRGTSRGGSRGTSRGGSRGSSRGGFRGTSRGGFSGSRPERR
ncbi:hypothetical protein INT44_002754 [Umbelopsis vinacea]|uniref:RRM domain-containing protein n=1 Tax=Umbelopsis vinacea TaxID=44442 RepID=A0A8H7UKI3_9FUNG|nr:hypothetical protein INT44_002754 [Umbelopsis vinacea]